ncbi:hypothetical protein A2U01_0080884 [Trifolium medium]|uniref:Uncharacterized protein n=1 Tax=Trifolium medium TaxID=97028 RepID=A0A392TES4_9FABA|nr:hypothetical protein [Trifolium medium]
MFIGTADIGISRYRNHRYVRLGLPLSDHILQDLRFSLGQTSDKLITAYCSRDNVVIAKGT